MPQNQPKADVMTMPEKVIEYIGFSSAALEKAAANEQAREQQMQKIAELIPGVVDALVSGERIEEGQREKAAKQLRDPVVALEILAKVAVHRNAAEMSLGEPVPGNGQAKQASAGRPAFNSLESPHVGIRTTQVKQSSVNFFNALGLPAPSSE